MQDAVIEQFSEGWIMLKQAIENAPDELMYGNQSNWIYVKVIYHVIETAEFYIRDTPQGMEWGKQFPINWEGDSLEIIKGKINKSTLIEYLDEVANKLVIKVQKFNRETWFRKDEFGDWFASIFSKFLYLLRHTMLHIGELAKALREVEGKKIVWN